MSEPLEKNKQPGRNDLCYCNSGKKYKKCHLDADEKARQLENEKKEDLENAGNGDEKEKLDIKRVVACPKTFNKNQNQNVQRFRIPRRSNG